MRYTKTALLAFGCGLLLGLVVLGAEIKSLARVASGIMALGIAAIPVGMAADWRRAVKTARGTLKAAARRPSGANRRPRKSALPKR
jgi:TM2 domain-containing membrane protein YozV